MVSQITKEELLKLLKDRDTLIVNVLDREDYDALHIAGSISIPYEEMIVEGWKRLDRKKRVVTYCKNTLCSASRESAEFLASKGFSVRAYEGGIEEWSKSGLPTERGSAA